MWIILISWRKTCGALQRGRRALGGAMGRAYLRLWGVTYGGRLQIGSIPFCRRHPESTIELGANVTLANSLAENPAGVFHPTVLVTSRSGARLKIGDRVGISGAVFYCTHEIVVEDNVCIGAGSRIYDTDFHPVDATARRQQDLRHVKAAPIRICEDAWLGANTTILKGVTVGPRAIVGAGAVVARDVPADTIVAGVPARVVRQLPTNNVLNVER